MAKFVPLRPADHKENAITDDPVDHMEPLPESKQSELAGLMYRMIVWICIGGTPNKIAARVMVLATALNISLGKSIVTQADIGRACDVSREAVSLMSNELRDQFGLTTYNNRSEENRNRCRKAHS